MGTARQQLSNHDFTDEECAKLRDAVVNGVHPKLTKHQMRELATSLASLMPRESVDTCRKRLIALRCAHDPRPLLSHTHTHYGPSRTWTHFTCLVLRARERDAPKTLVGFRARLSTSPEEPFC